MKKKKDKETMKDRLLRRFKIKETIDRTIPDLERKRRNQRKGKNDESNGDEV